MYLKLPITAPLCSDDGNNLEVLNTQLLSSIRGAHLCQTRAKKIDNQCHAMRWNARAPPTSVALLSRVAVLSSMQRHETCCYVFLQTLVYSGRLSHIYPLQPGRGRICNHVPLTHSESSRRDVPTLSDSMERVLMLYAVQLHSQCLYYNNDVFGIVDACIKGHVWQVLPTLNNCYQIVREKYGFNYL